MDWELDFLVRNCLNPFTSSNFFSGPAVLDSYPFASLSLQFPVPSLFLSSFFFSPTAFHLDNENALSNHRHPSTIQRFQKFGEEPFVRTAEDIAFATALFIAKGGSFVNYYMVGSPTHLSVPDNRFLIIKDGIFKRIFEICCVWRGKSIEIQRSTMEARIWEALALRTWPQATTMKLHSMSTVRAWTQFYKISIFTAFIIFPWGTRLGLTWQSKYAHLKDLHASIKSISNVLLFGKPTILSLGPLQSVWIFSSNCIICSMWHNSSKI